MQRKSGVRQKRDLFFPLQKRKVVTDEDIGGGSLKSFVPRITINLTKNVNKTYKKGVTGKY